jgi:hypothetical protein
VNGTVVGRVESAVVGERVGPQVSGVGMSVCIVG